MINRTWDGNLIYAERAAEPGDVFWENLSISTSKRFRKGLLTYFVTIVCLGIAFGITYLINNQINKYGTEYFKNNNSFWNEFLWQVISLIASFPVAIVNVILERLIRAFTSYEKHETYTKYHLSMAFKLTTAMFINTGISPLFENFGRDNWFDTRGLMVDIFYIAITTSLISPFSYLLDPSYFIRLGKQWREKKKGHNSKLTQRQANALFEGPPLDMAQRYSNTMLLLCMAVFYAFPFPLISIISLLGALFQYWVEKYLLLRRHKIPEHIGETMAQIFSNMIPFFCLLYGISLFAFSNVLTDGNQWIGTAAFIFTLLFMLTPVRYTLDLLKEKTFKSDNYTHQEEGKEFLTDYDRSNPMTK